MPDNLVTAICYLMAMHIDGDADVRFTEHAAAAFEYKNLNRLSHEYPERPIRWWVLDYWNRQLQSVGAEPMADTGSMSEQMRLFEDYAIPLIRQHNLPFNTPVIPIAGSLAMDRVI